MLVQSRDDVLDEIVAELLSRLKEPTGDHVVRQRNDVVIVSIRIRVGQRHCEHVQRLTGGEVAETSLGQSSQSCAEMEQKLSDK